MKHIYKIAIIVFLLLLLPIVLWHIQPVKKLNIAIIDKTVPDETYREHLGITWVLNHFKYRKDNDREYEAKRDYYGFRPDEKNKTFKKSQLPKSYADYDAIYLADTYGVYEQDLPWHETRRRGSKSKKIEGGLGAEEWAAITERLDKETKSLLVAEFNSFASPTEESVRRDVTGHLGIEWDGWTGRYFKELDPAKNEEIPQWILDEYKDRWKYKGPGFLLVNDFDGRVSVLESGKHVQKGIKLKFTKEGKKEFGVNASPQYNYWFDIVTPAGYAKSLANYEWSLTDEGKDLIEQQGIPETFAAVVSNERGQSKSYYFAGDYNDIKNVPSYYKVKGLESVYGMAHRYSDQSLYWSAYVPMMGKILEYFEQSLKTAAGESKEEAKQTMAMESKSKSMKYSARVNKDSFQVLKDGKWQDFTIKGVNIGMGKPGSFPGEAAITEDEYYRWLQRIGEMNANTIRVYTLHPPGFYNALKRYNDEHEKKIYLFHGVWINEQNLVDSMDAFEKGNIQGFHKEMHAIIDVIHGNGNVEHEAGHASGRYRSDISEYVAGWILGIEWDPHMVENTNLLNKSVGEYDGTFFRTKQAEPFEHWLAAQMDEAATYEKEHYGWMRPMSFTNWPTTDLLSHPSDSTGLEDIVSVNPNKIYAKGEAKETGQFASYHIYPYYPDFMNYDKKYRTHKDHRGEKNNYAGYLKDLHNGHRLPILVAEFGVPGSRGKAHDNIYGWNQGNLSEKQQGEIVTRLYEDIMEEKMLGGLVFTWQDEWFKRTWNTMDQDHPERRPFWSNAQTNEQQFGMMSFDRDKIKPDGNTEDWKRMPLYEKKGNAMKALYVDHDERYLYIRVDLDSKLKERPILLLDILPEQGNSRIKGMDGVEFTNKVDFIADLRARESRIKIDKYYDFFTYQYGFDLKMINKGKKPKKNSGEFVDIHYALNKRMLLADQKRWLPFSSYETGKLVEGNGNPDAPEYNSLTDYHVSADGIVELRIPWLLIQAKDPSRKEFVGDLYEDGIEASEIIKGIDIGALYLDTEGKVIDSFPGMQGDQLRKMKRYKWDNWETPLYEERLKQSYYILQEKFKKY